MKRTTRPAAAQATGLDRAQAPPRRPLARLARRFAPYLRPHRALLAGSTAALLGTTAMRLLEPWPLAWVIDRLLTPGTTAGPQGEVDGLAGLAPTQALLLCAVAVVSIAALKASAGYLSTIGFALAGHRVLGAVREQLFRHLQSLSLGWHQRRRTGDLTMRLVNDVGMLKEATITALLPMTANALVLAGMLAVMLWLEPRLAVLALLPLPLLALMTVRSSRRIHQASRRQRDGEGALAATAAESMAAIRTVQSLAIEDSLASRFAGSEQHSQHEGLLGKRLAAGLERSVELLVAVATALVLWQGARLVLEGRLSPGDLIVFLSYLKNTFRPVREHAKHTARLSKALAAAERIADVLDETPEVQDRRGAIAAPRLAGAIRFDDVHFAYDGGRPVLDGLSLCIAEGEQVAIVGASGAGKSTLASLLLRLYEPQSGSLTIDGHALTRYTLASLRRQIALVPQEPLLFAASVHDNIALGHAGPVGREAVREAARRAQADTFVERLPQGYDTVIGERGSSLSGGQRQRLAIARALLRDCRVLLLDEPTAALDAQHEAQVIEALRTLMRGRTTMLITHDLPLAAGADRIVVLHEGRVAEQGTHAQLLARDGRYAALWRASQRSPDAPQEVAHAD